MTATVGNPLQISFCFSFMRRGGKTAGKQAPGEEVAPEPPGTIAHPYENSIKTISEVTTVEEFWAIYDFLKRPNDLPSTTDYHFFRGGIKPTWEDASNAKGGKWIVRLPKGLSSRYWEEIILALIGGQFSGVPDGEVCGAVLSVRYSEDILGVWNKSSTDRELIAAIRDAIKKVLQLPPHANMEYKPHQASMQDRSSFRNTQVWKPKSLEGRTDVAPREATRPNRSGSWTEREERKPKSRDMGRAWR
jgi:translation initiation factor 4E